MNKEKISELISTSKGNESNICQIHVIKDGSEEAVFCKPGYSESDAVHIASVTKGVMALLTGIAIDKGFTSRDWTKAALDLLGGRSGVTGEFKYSTLGIQILAGVLENATGKKCIDWANEVLFSPLNIPTHCIHGDSSKEDQFDYLMSKKPRKNEWYSDPCNTVTAGWGLCMSAQDLAQIGDMILNDGQYMGKRVVSSKWLIEMTAAHQKLGERFGYMSYGYLWYRPFDDRDVIAAIGDGGNVIYVNKDEGVAVGITGTFKPRIFDRVEFIEKHILHM